MATDVWRVDTKNSEITFTLRHLVLAEISGHVRKWHATLRIDPERPTESAAEAVLDARSIDTGEVERDAHIRSAEFLSAVAFPEILFRGHSIDHLAAKRYRVMGDLTLREVTREVILDVQEVEREGSENGTQIATFGAQTTFNRQHFGLHWNQDLDTGGIVLGDKVLVRISIKAVLSKGVS